MSSQLVLREAGRGDPEAAALRLQALAGVRFLDITDRAISLADSIIAATLVPATAALAVSVRLEQRASMTSETEQGDRVAALQAHQVSPATNAAA